MTGGKEKLRRPADPDYAQEYRYTTDGGCTVRALWVDMNGSAWLETNDGQRVVVPAELRRLIAKRIREGKFR